MAFLSKKSSAVREPAPKKGFGVWSLFNPNIGATLRPLGESGRMLVNLIAFVFASNGLFPRNHPALQGVPGARLTLLEVLRIGWSNVVFTREALPRALLYFAVIISIGFSTIAIMAAAFHAFVGHAHAQCAPPGCFTAPGDPANGGGANDIALNWMNWLFLAQNMPDNLNNYTDPSTGVQEVNPVGSADSPGGAEIQAVLINALGLYSYCMLVIGAIVLFYHLASMITETAHHGVVLGRRANQVWAPIRLVVAIGLLVPVGAIGLGTGLNSGQYIILEVAKWGTGMASNVWALFLTQLTNDNFNFQAPDPPYMRTAVTSSYASAACIEAYNEYSDTVGGAKFIAADGIEIVGADQSIKHSFTPITRNANDPPVAADLDLCGYYIVPAAQTASQGGGSNLLDPTNVTEQQIINQADTNIGLAFQDMRGETYGEGIYDILPFLPRNTRNGTGGGAPPFSTDLETMISDYMGDMTVYYNGLSQGLGASMQNIANVSGEEGWASAGTWFNTIARLQGDLIDIPRDIVPKASPPQVERIVKENPTLFGPNSIEYNVMNSMTAFNEWINEGFGWDASALFYDPIDGTDGNTQQYQIELASVGSLMDQSTGSGDRMDKIFQAIDLVASMNGVWHTEVTNCGGSSCFTLGVQFNQANPLAEIAALGHANINTAYELYNQFILLMEASSAGNDSASAASVFSQGSSSSMVSLLPHFVALASQAGAQSAQTVGTVIGFAVTAFFTAGFLLAFFLPLIPFYRFFFATLSWFLSMFEAMIAVPIIALAHLTPEGEGFMGEKAKTAYYFVFNIFLKPVLMIFGLVAGYLMFCLAVSVLNILYMTAVSGAGGVSAGHFTLARIVYSILYVVILYLACNKCFQLIDWLPDNALKWMGSGPLHHANMGNPEEVGGYMTAGTGYIEQQLVQTTGQAAAGPLGAVGLASWAGGSAADRASLGQAKGQLGNEVSQLTGSSGVGKSVGAALNTVTGMAGAASHGLQGLLSAVGSVGSMGENAKNAGAANYQSYVGAHPGSEDSAGAWGAFFKGAEGADGGTGLAGAPQATRDFSTNMQTLGDKNPNAPVDPHNDSEDHGGGGGTGGIQPPPFGTTF